MSNPSSPHIATKYLGPPPLHCRLFLPLPWLLSSPSPPSCQEVKPTFLKAGRANAIRADDAPRLRHITWSMNGSYLSQTGVSAGTTDDGPDDDDEEDPPSSMILKAALFP